MARLVGKFIIGSIGDLTFTKLGGQQIMKSKVRKGKIKQSKGTKKASEIFGKASSLSSYIRLDAYPVINDLNDWKMPPRLNKEVYPILIHCFDKGTGKYTFEKDSFERLAGFDFNIKAPLKNSLWIRPEITLQDDQLVVRLPSIEIPTQLKFPKQSDTCTLKLVVNMYALGMGYGKRTIPKTLEISKSWTTVPAQEWTFEVPNGCLCVISLGLSYFNVNQNIHTPINNKGFNPAAICNALYAPGTFPAALKSKWEIHETRF